MAFACARAVEDEGDAAVEFGEDMGGRGGAGEAGAVGGGGGDGGVELLEELLGDGVVGDAEGDGVSAGGDEGGDGGTAGEDEGERAGPEVVGEFFGDGGPVGHALAGGFAIGDVDDEGVGWGAAFGVVDFLDGGGVAGVGTEAVDGFGGEGDEVAGRAANWLLLGSLRCRRFGWGMMTRDFALKRVEYTGRSPENGSRDDWLAFCRCGEKTSAGRRCHVTSRRCCTRRRRRWFRR